MWLWLNMCVHALLRVFLCGCWGKGGGGLHDRRQNWGVTVVILLEELLAREAGRVHLGRRGTVSHCGFANTARRFRILSTAYLEQLRGDFHGTCDLHTPTYSRTRTPETQDPLKLSTEDRSSEGHGSARQDGSERTAAQWSAILPLSSCAPSAVPIRRTQRKAQCNEAVAGR